MAGCVDIVRICFHAKNQLENAKSLTSVNKFAVHLDEELVKYGQKHSILAEALAGENEFKDLQIAQRAAKSVTEVDIRHGGRRGYG